MQEEAITIRQKEATRYDVLRRVLDGTLSLGEAFVYMKVSYRQALRLKTKALGKGLMGLAHQNRGRPPANKMSAEVRRQVLKLTQDDFVFGGNKKDYAARNA